MALLAAVLMGGLLLDGWAHSHGEVDQSPAVVSTWALVTLVGFFLGYAQPIEDGFTPLTIRPSTTDAIYPMLYVGDARGTPTFHPTISWTPRASARAPSSSKASPSASSRGRPTVDRSHTDRATA